MVFKQFVTLLRIIPVGVAAVLFDSDTESVVDGADGVLADAGDTETTGVVTVASVPVGTAGVEAPSVSGHTMLGVPGVARAGAAVVLVVSASATFPTGAVLTPSGWVGVAL